LSPVLIGFSVFAAGVFALIGLFAEWHYRQLPELPTQPANLPTSSVEVIVPARNEAATIERVTASLLALHYPTFLVTVIDDHSTDNTAMLAVGVGANVIRLEAEPPPGWTGKCNACDQGARRSEADWLLFTDADTYHTPDSLTCAVAYAESHDLDALSLLLRQECVGFWDRLILPLAYQNYFAVLRPSKPAFNGQYILIRRSVYNESGGFGAVRGRVMEDVALAELLADQGYKTALLNGHQVASVRMYADLSALLHGMTKTAFTAARDRGAVGWLLGSVTFIGVFVIVMFAYGVLSGQTPLIGAALLICAVNGLGLLPWLSRFGVRPTYAALNLIGIGVLWLIGMVGTFRALRGVGVRWKDRVIIETR